MMLTNEQKNAIEIEFKEWTELQYAGKDKKERQKLGQFFTPPVLSIRMLETFDTIQNKKMLDPTVGAAGLLAAAVIAGADPRLVYGIELDDNVLKVARRRMLKFGVQPDHLKHGNALESESYDMFDNIKEHDTFAVFDKIDSKTLDFTLVKNNKVVKEKRLHLPEDVEKVKSLIERFKVTNVKLYRI